MGKLSAVVPESHYDIVEDKNYAQVAMVMPDGTLANNIVAFNWDGEYVRFSTIKSRQKYKNFTNDQRVAVCIVDPDNAWRYLEIRGRVELEDDKDRSFINSIAKKYMNQDEYPFDKPGDERVTLTLIPSRVRAEYVHAADGKPENIGVTRD
ncbi:MAG: PPOX class F420-dependent oxidoreductase [bacterium]|nr:PPOX class F420-dependent enzyme [Deltaproteobacteria bacterium]MCP4906217.1 PPOX class F420-dependent oxidoreductase [bacterium]